jgi:glycine hydroxymethyltransferase
MILCTEEFAEYVDKGCPLVIGGPLPHVMAAKAIALIEASQKDFQSYAARIVENSDAMAKEFIKRGVTVATGGTENHLMLLDVAASFNLNGRQAEHVLRKSGVTLNRNALPFDANGPWYTSGLRIGTPAVSTLGMGVEQMVEIADIISTVLKNSKPATITKGKNSGKPSKARAVCDVEVQKDAKKRIKALLDEFLLYPTLDLDFLQKHFPLEENK